MDMGALHETTAGVDAAEGLGAAKDQHRRSSSNVGLSPAAVHIPGAPPASLSTSGAGDADDGLPAATRPGNGGDQATLSDHNEIYDDMSASEHSCHSHAASLGQEPSLQAFFEPSTESFSPALQGDLHTQSHPSTEDLPEEGSDAAWVSGEHASWVGAGNGSQGARPMSAPASRYRQQQQRAALAVQRQRPQTARPPRHAGERDTADSKASRAGSGHDRWAICAHMEGDGEVMRQQVGSTGPVRAQGLGWRPEVCPISETPSGFQSDHI